MNYLSPRDQTVLQLVQRFKQATSKQIHELVFDGLTQTPSQRALRRLVDRAYLRRIELRLVGGGRGGSGQYVYALGRRGWHEVNDGKWVPTRRVDRHALATLDTYIELRRLEVSGKLSIAGLSTEPDSWAVIGGTELKPDMYTELVFNGSSRRLWWEVDLATESQKQVRGKLDAVVRAYANANSTAWPKFPLTIWVAIDAEREKELRWLVSQMTAEAQRLFRVCQRETIGSVLNLG